MAVKLSTWFLSQGMMSRPNSSSNHSNVRFFSPSYRLLPASCKMRHRNLRVDLCHQANDEDNEDEDSSSQEALLDKTSNKSSSSKTDTHRKCFPSAFSMLEAAKRL